MDVMVIFDAVIVVFGLYMVISAFKMKKTGSISTAVISGDEIKKCRDVNGFISYMYWKEAAFGVIVIIVGTLGLINDLIISLGPVNIAEMLVFIVAFVWFQQSLRKARERYL